MTHKQKILRLVSITIPGKPFGKQRPKAGMAFGKGGKKFPNIRTPDETVIYENLVKTTFTQKYPDHIPFTDELTIEIDAYYYIPESLSKKKRKRAEFNIDRPTKIPDYDNIAKVIGDALNGVAYVDDKQIVTARIRKLFSDKPRVEVKIKERERDETG